MDRPFRTDGCSVVADLDQAECCWRHDWRYWQGGAAADRRAADLELYECIRATSRWSWLAPVRWFGVRVGGLGILPTPFRWGYGWKWPRTMAPVPDLSPYRATTFEEDLETALIATRSDWDA